MAVAPDNIVLQDVQTIDVTTLNAVIVTPGPGAEAEAKRFRGHAALFCFANSASQERDLAWFRDLLPEAFST